MTNKAKKTEAQLNADIIKVIYTAINDQVKGNTFVCKLISNEMQSAKGQKRLVAVASKIKQDAIKSGTTATKYSQWAILKTQISQASDTHSLQGAGDKQDVMIAPKRQAQGGGAKPKAQGNKPEASLKAKTEDKAKPVTITAKQVTTFVVDHMNEDQLNDLIQAWHLKNDKLAKAS